MLSHDAGVDCSLSSLSAQMVQVPTSCRLDISESCALPATSTAATTTATVTTTTAATAPPCELDHDQQQAAAVAAVALLSAIGAGGSGRRRSTYARASFAVWADIAPANSSSSAVQAAGSSSSPPAETGAALHSPRASSLVNDHGSAHPRAARLISEGAGLGSRSAMYRRSSGEDMFARGSVIQPSPKLLGLMEIHDRGSTAG